MIKGRDAAQSASAVNGCQRWARSHSRHCSGETLVMGSIPVPSSTSPSPSEPDGGARPGGELLGGVAVDDGDLDPPRAADQGDERPGGMLAVGAGEPVDPRPRQLDGPAVRGRPLEAAG